MGYLTIPSVAKINYWILVNNGLGRKLKLAKKE